MNAKQLFEAARAVLPLVPYGQEAANAATAIANLITDASDTMSMTEAEAKLLEGSREDLERAVNAHADRTAASLG